MREPPHNLEAERSALGSVLLSAGKWAVISSLLVTDSFYLPAHREIFEAMGAVHRRHEPFDGVSIGAELKRRGAMGRLEGGESYLLELATSVPSVENAAHYAGMVLDCAQRRALIQLCAETASRAYGDAPCCEILENAAGDLSRLSMRSGTSLLRAGDMAPELMAEFERRVMARNDGSDGIDGVRVGVQAFDDCTLGWRPGDLVVVAADPGGGKTAFAMQSAYVTALEDGGTALAFNLEMTRRQLVERAFSRLARVNSQRLKRGDIDLEGMEGLRRAASKLRGAGLYVEDRMFGLGEVMARAREWRSRHVEQRGLLVVDYLQLLRSQERSDSRAREIGRWCGSLKELSKELGIVMILVSQLNRAAAQMGQKPTMRNLRDSGEIEQAADCIVLLNNENATPDGTVFAIIEKNRSGPTRTVPVHWCARYYEFGDAQGYQPAV